MRQIIFEPSSPNWHGPFWAPSFVKTLIAMAVLSKVLPPGMVERTDLLKALDASTMGRRKHVETQPGTTTQKTRKRSILGVNIWEKTGSQKLKFEHLDFDLVIWGSWDKPLHTSVTSGGFHHPCWSSMTQPLPK